MVIRVPALIQPVDTRVSSQRPTGCWSASYFNEPVHGIGIPAKQSSAQDPAGLKYSVECLLIISSFPYRTSLQLPSCCSISNLDSSHSTRLPAKSIAHGGSLCILLVNTSIIIITSRPNGLWCNSSSMLKYWVNPQRVFTIVLVALYISWMLVMYSSGMLLFLSAHQIWSRGTWL